MTRILVCGILLALTACADSGLTNEEAALALISGINQGQGYGAPRPAFVQTICTPSGMNVVCSTIGN